MYQGGQERNGFKMGWEDPTQTQGPGGQFGFGPRGGGPGWGHNMGEGYGPGPPMGYGGHFGGPQFFCFAYIYIYMFLEDFGGV